MHLRTLAGGVETGERLGLHAAAVNPRIEAITGFAAKLRVELYKTSISTRYPMLTDELRQRRVDVIVEHMTTEVTKEFDRTLATFNGHPRYEIVPTGQIFDGDEEVMGYYVTTRTAFPDRRHKNARFHATDDAVIVEFDLLGTNLGVCRRPASPSGFR